MPLFGGGCFWSTEGVFYQIIGIEKVISGYADGNVLGHITYKEICSGLMGYAEVIGSVFDINLIS